MAHNEEQANPVPDDEDGVVRCPNCDSVLTISYSQCLMCGVGIADPSQDLARTNEDDQSRSRAAEEEHREEIEQNEDRVALPSAEGEHNDAALVTNVEEISTESEEVGGDAELQGDDGAKLIAVRDDEAIRKERPQGEEVIESVLIEERSRNTIWLVGGFIVLIGIVGFAILSTPGEVALALLPTVTEPAAPYTPTPTRTPLASNTPLPSPSPTNTLTPLPSETPRSPRAHQVVSGETLFSLSLRYGVTMDSIAAENGIDTGAGIQVSQNMLIPWPTATPPLEPVAINQGGQVIIADPTDCQMYEIKSGDTFLGIAYRERIDLEALTAVNRFTDQTILQPGDLICIPKIIVGGQLPPTAGPSPTPTEIPPPAGPYLLYPVEEAVIEPPDQPFYLQWVAVKDLEPDEWYMVELTDLTLVDSHPLREFTRDNAIRIPVTWRPREDSTHLIRWRVRIVKVSGQRNDGSFIYTFGGTNSEDALFHWPGAIPTATPTPTPTVTPTPE